MTLVLPCVLTTFRGRKTPEYPFATPPLSCEDAAKCEICVQTIFGCGKCHGVEKGKIIGLVEWLGGLLKVMEIGSTPALTLNWPCDKDLPNQEWANGLIIGWKVTIALG